MPKANKAAAQGAQLSTSKPLVGSYFGNHKKALSLTLQEQRNKPVASLLTCSVIGIAILLPTMLAILLVNVHKANLNWDGATQMTLMLQDSVSSVDASQLTQRIAAVNGVEEALFVDKNEALAEFKEVFHLGNTLDHLADNPLPHSIVATLDASIVSIAQARELQSELKALSEVDIVQLDLMWVQRLRAISDFLTYATWILALMLGIAVILILGNTIRLAIENRKDEIAVLKLVGGTDAFVCRPFLYLGTFYGLGGGLLALCFSLIVLNILSAPIEALTTSYQSEFSLSGLDIESTLFILFVGTFLGWLGARIAVKRHISEIEPN